MKKILLIDDDPYVCASITKVLNREGYDVTTVPNADEGIALLATEKFDLLIADLIMPGKDGVHAIREVRGFSVDIKIIAISGGGHFGLQAYKPEAITTTAYLQAALEAGADWVLSKPFERAEIVDSVRRLLTLH